MVVCLYNEAPPAYLNSELAGRTTLERLIDYVRGLPSVAGQVEAVDVVVYTTHRLSDLPGAWDVREGPPLSQSSLVELLASQTRDADTEIVVGFLDEPFLSIDLTARLLHRHRDYRAEYTFADGYPKGLAPEIVSGRAVSHLRQLAGPERVDREGVFPIVQKDINRLDVETELSPEDQRLLRLSLSVDTRANLLLCERLSVSAPDAIDEWPAHVRSQRRAHRTLPRFVSVQVLEQEVQRLSYSPYPGLRDDILAPGQIMGAEHFSSLVTQLESFAPEAVVHVSLWGELALHPAATTLIRRVLASDSLTLLVETAGVGWSDDARETLLGTDDERLLVIIGLDSNERDIYEAVRGNGFEEAQRFATEAVERLPGSAYVQAVRSEQTESALDRFYREWKERTDHVIIQKYDYFCGVLPQRKVGDISPLDRFPCWHLQRDLYVLVDGTVPLCREDLKREHALGNAFSDGVAAAWSAGERRYAEHVGGTYGDICGVCDEYYTFTF
jgi:spiro-SPASM protein